MTKKALLINDTSDAYHWGCFGTSSEIQAQLQDRGYTVSRFGVVDVHNLKIAPRNSEQMADTGFQRAFCADNPNLIQLLTEADVVILNGEGTLHGVGQAAFNLLYIAHLAQHEFNKPVHAINMSLFPADSGSADGPQDRFYATYLGSLERIVLRESQSFGIAKSLGLNATLGFDCLPLFLKRQEIEPLPPQGKVIVLGGGLGLTPDAMAGITAALTKSFDDYTFRYVTGAQGHPALDDAPLLEALSGMTQVEHYTAQSFEDWIETINTASCLVSGRFHHSIAAAFVNTPVVSFRAGTPKLTALMETLELPAPLSPTDGATMDTMIAQVTAAVEGNGAVLSKDIRERCLDRAGLNFDQL